MQFIGGFLSRSAPTAMLSTRAKLHPRAEHPVLSFTLPDKVIIFAFGSKHLHVIYAVGCFIWSDSHRLGRQGRCGDH